jgi:hypothetical protein
MAKIERAIHVPPHGPHTDLVPFGEEGVPVRIPTKPATD